MRSRMRMTASLQLLPPTATIPGPTLSPPLLLRQQPPPILLRTCSLWMPVHLPPSQLHPQQLQTPSVLIPPLLLQRQPLPRCHPAVCFPSQRSRRTCSRSLWRPRRRRRKRSTCTRSRAPLAAPRAGLAPQGLPHSRQPPRRHPQHRSQHSASSPRHLPLGSPPRQLLAASCRQRRPCSRARRGARAAPIPTALWTSGLWGSPVRSRSTAHVATLSLVWVSNRGSELWNMHSASFAGLGC
mmetsp:Transcript_17766/g.53500  ORF Transcript_17766/g.53500 Transcript_17766/m.53500 type:complete len:240 (+) Transcript_17766:4685-5404(+)